MKQKSKKFNKPGSIAKISGQYAIISAAGKSTKKERTIPKGKRFPPTLKRNQKYVLVDRTKTR